MNITSQPVAIGFRAHSGWTVAVAVTGSLSKPVVLERRRFETADPAIHGSKQPFHAAERLDFQDAEELIRRCRDSSVRLATAAVTAFVAQLTKSRRPPSAAGILFASGRPLPDLAATLRSHSLIHTAEGEFYRDVLVQASGHCSLFVTRVKEREVWDQCPANMPQLIGELGRSLGPPWTQDEKLASLAAWLALANPA